MKKKPTSFPAYVTRIRNILDSARSQSLRAVNAAMITAYWHIGREIVEEEQKGKKRAEYGKEILQTLAGSLRSEFGNGFSVSNLKNMRQFYLVYRDTRPVIGYTPSGDSATTSTESPVSTSKHPAITVKKAIRQTVSGEFNRLGFHLSWSHYCLLMRISRTEARNFYEAECINASWSVRELERQINSLLFDRLARSRDKKGVVALANKGHEVFTPRDLIKDPYVLEFTGLPEPPHFTESQLEEALITMLQHFLLELGKDIMFVARQRRITIEGDHYFIDLVFYHRELRCFLLIDLKIGKLTQQDVGQMLLYTGYYKTEVTRGDENPPVGLILCTDKNEAAVRYTSYCQMLCMTCQSSGHLL